MDTAASVKEHSRNPAVAVVTVQGVLPTSTVFCRATGLNPDPEMFMMSRAAPTPSFTDTS